MLKDHLPEAYLPWAIASEKSKRMNDFEALRDEIDMTLAYPGAKKSHSEFHIQGQASSSASSSSSSDSESGEDSDVAPSPSTPATSVFSPSSCSSLERIRFDHSPQSYLLSIPPAHSVPQSLHAAYSSQLTLLTGLASRLSALKKLSARYEREEGKRRWLESLERGLAGDKALRRAFSNGHNLCATAGVTAEPIKGSRLRLSWTAEDEERAEQSADGAIHPAMLEQDASDDFSSFDHESDSESSSCDEEVGPRPMIRLSSSTEDIADEKIVLARPSPFLCDVLSISEDDAPALVTSRSDDSLAEADGWEPKTPDSPTRDTFLLPSPLVTSKWSTPPSPPRPVMKRLDANWGSQESFLEVACA